MNDACYWDEYEIPDLEDKGIVSLGRGNIISKIDIQEKPGGHPIYSSSAKKDGMFGKYGDYMFDEEMITWSIDGGGTLFYRPRHKFSVTNVCGYMRLDTSVLDYRFVHAALCLQHSRITFDYQTKAHPSVIRNLYRIPIPPLLEQKKIADILSAIDTAIKDKEEILCKRERVAELLAVDLWNATKKEEMVLLADIATLHRGKFSHRPRNDPSFYGGDIPFVQTGDIPKKGVRISEFNQTLNQKGLDVSRLFPKGTLVITIAATIGEVGILDFPACFPDSLVGMTPDKEKCNPIFLLFALRHFKKDLVQLAPQSAQSNLNLEILGKFPIPLPPISVQNQIADIVVNQERENNSRNMHIAKLRFLKQAMLSDLLSGRKRVSV